MQEPILKACSISLSIEEIKMLEDVDFCLYPGEVHVVLGENGAGKSSLAKVICGIYSGYAGTLFLDGNEVSIRTPEVARNYGIISIQQESTVFENLTVAENIFVNNPVFFGKPSRLLNKKAMNEKSREILESLEFPLNPTAKVKHLDLAQRRMVELARISILKPRILILDEPASSMNISEMQSLYDVIQRFKKTGVAIMLITHQIKEFSFQADRLTILRDGKVVLSEQSFNGNTEDIGKKVWGEYYTDKYPKLNLKSGQELFFVEDLCTDLLEHITFALHEGEILGITGLVGSGRSQLAKSIIGHFPHTSGNFYVDRLKAKINSPKDAIDYGIAFVTEDRYDNGLFLNLNVLKNVFSINNSQDDTFLFHQKQNYKLFQKYQKKVNLDIHNPFGALFPVLSGGTQQKVILLRWLFTCARIFIFDEPTRGVDIASKVDIYNLMNDLARKKAGILLISSSFEELTGMCDRILILKDGKIAYEARRSVPGDFENLYEYVI